MADFDIAVVGAGLTGASLIVGLQGSGLKIALIESQTPQKAEGWDARIYAYSPENIRFLNTLGVWQRLAQTRHQAVSLIKVYGDAGGELMFSAYESGVEALAWIAEASPLQVELWETLRRQNNVTLFCPASVCALEKTESHVQMALTDGRRLSAKLLIGADGSQSSVRTLSNIQAQVKPYPQHGVVANFKTEKPHHGTAFQWFDQGEILAYLPLPGQQMSMVWSVPPARAKALVEASSEALESAVAKAGHHMLGSLQCVGPAREFPLNLMKVASPIASRTILIGDAAHGIHPLSGHGVNLGFQDAAALVEVLCQRPDWMDPGSHTILRRYARMRAEEPFVMQHFTDSIYRLFNTQNKALKLARNCGMNALSTLPILSNTLVRYAICGRI